MVFQENVKKIRCDVQGQEYRPTRSLPSMFLFFFHVGARSTCEDFFFDPSQFYMVFLELIFLGVKICLDVATPYICIPQSVDSDEHVLIDLGEISVDTAFEVCNNSQ